MRIIAPLHAALDGAARRPYHDDCGASKKSKTGQNI
jgi:hypothetical protein